MYLCVYLFVCVHFYLYCVSLYYPVGRLWVLFHQYLSVLCECVCVVCVGVFVCSIVLFFLFVCFFLFAC